MSKFNVGDLVEVKSEDKCAAIILEFNKCNGGYSLFRRYSGVAAWFHSSELAFVEKGREDLLHEWKAEIENTRKIQSDIDWVFANGNEVIGKMYEPSIQRLADMLKIGDLWGKRGEGFVFISNSYKVLLLARKFLEVGDKEGFVSYCESL